MFTILLRNLGTDDKTTVHVHQIPSKGEILTLHDEEDAIEYRVYEVSHFAYTPNEMHSYAAELTIVPVSEVDWRT